jgi:hypothetical protein
MFETRRMAKGLTGVALAVVLLSGGAASATTLRASGGHSTGDRHHGRHHPVIPAGVFGTVASVNGSSTAGACGVADTAGAFTLTAFRSTIDTVDVSTTTTFSEHGVTTPSFVNVCVGEKVGAVGTISSATVTATAVFVIAGKTSPPLHDSLGTVENSGPHGATNDLTGPTGPHSDGHPASDHHGFGFGFGAAGKGHSTGHSSGHDSH